MKTAHPIDGPERATPVQAVLGALTTTIACVVPVFLVGGLAVQIRDELHFDPAGLGLVVAAYFGVGALASMPSGALAERFGATRTARAGILVPGDGRGPRRSRGLVRGERATGALVVIGAAAVLSAGWANALGTFLVDAAVDSGMDPGAAGLALTAGGAICITSRVTGGWLADRLTGGHLALVAGLIGAGAAGLGLLAVPRAPALAVGVLLGFGLGWSWPGLLNFAVVRLHPQAPAAATSITQTGVYAGGCLGPLAFGATATHADYPTAWLAGAVAMLLAAAAMLVGARLLRHHGQRH